MFKNKRKIIFLIASVFVLLLISVISFSCMGMGPFSGSANNVADEGIETFEVQRGDIYQLISTTGAVDSEALNTYTTTASGEILSALEKGDTFKEGDTLVEIDNSEGMLQLERIEKDLELSEISLKAAKSNYQDALDANHISVQLTDLNTEKAEESAKSALNSLESANKSAELSYESAESALKEAKEALSRAKKDPATTSEQLDQYKSNVESAEEQLESAEISGESSASQAESSYNQSLLSQSSTYWSNLSSLQSAESQIRSTLNSISQAEIQLELAQMDYEEVKEGLDDYILYAPYNGTVVSSDFEVGNQSGGNTISIISDSFLVNATVGETDITKVSAGNEAYITLDAYPDSQFSGEVEKIVSVAEEEGNIVSFGIIVKFSGTEDTQMYYGLSADVDIVVGKAEDVLYVPIQAVYTENGKSYVDLLTSEQIDSENITQAVKKVEVTTGINDYSYIEIISGLKDGDVIVTSRI